MTHLTREHGGFTPLIRALLVSMVALVVSAQILSASHSHDASTEWSGDRYECVVCQTAPTHVPTVEVHFEHTAPPVVEILSHDQPVAPLADAIELVPSPRGPPTL